MPAPSTYRLIRTPGDRDSTNEVSGAGGPSEIELTEAEVEALGIEKPKYKHNRASRRHKTKSQPPASRLQYSLDGTQDSKMTAFGSGEGQITTASSIVGLS